ncbi:MAG: ShlB/FhaC/HecB family hemolysin secretion/activation protein [Steroidobacteraceae bacterium]|nr:ShlB/FhaC/HecB family hemolysin secretion/activation protein [Steroidobacteraceae bacterium]
MSEMYAYRCKGTVRVAAPTMVTVATALLSASAWAQQVQSGAGATPSAPVPNAQDRLQAPDSPLTIPRVSERPLTAEESPRIRVSSFELSGAVEHPEVGLSVSAVRAILDEAVKAQPEAGYTIADLEAVSDKITDYYRKSGLVVAKAFIPAQDVRGGKVTVRVLEGKLSAIVVEQNKTYSAKTLLRPFDSLLGAPVAKDQIESALLTLTNYPGLSAFGVLSAGQDVGTTKLVLRVQKEERVGYDFAVDNQGSRLAGETRAQAAVTLNNLFGQADQLRTYALYGFDTSDSVASGLYGGFQYSLPIFDSRNFIYLGAATNSYDIGNVEDFADEEPQGDAFEARAGFRHAFAPTRISSGGFAVELQSKKSTFELAGVDQFEDKLTVLQTSADWSLVDQRFRGVNQISVSYSHGFDDVLGSLGEYSSEIGGASRTGATGEFDKFVVGLARLQRLTKGTSLLLNVRGQHSSDPLVSLEQVSLTGPDAVRAYRVTERAGTGDQENFDSALADTGVITTLEYIFPFPGLTDRPAFGNRTWGQVLQLSLFADYAHGELNDADSDQDAEFDIAGWGGSVQFNIPNKAFARVDVAKPFSNDNPDSDDVQAYFRFGVHF